MGGDADVRDRDPLDERVPRADGRGAAARRRREAAPALTPHGDALAPEAESAAPGGAPLPAPSRRLGAYDRLRHRIVSTLGRRCGRVAGGAAEAMLLVPDLILLLVRLALDPEVPPATRGLITGALAYYALPFDLLPEGLVGEGRAVDELVLAAAVLAHVLGPDLEPRARRHWSGREELRVVLADIIAAANALIGESIVGRLETLLRRRGVSTPSRRTRELEERAHGDRVHEGFEGELA